MPFLGLLYKNLQCQKLPNTIKKKDLWIVVKVEGVLGVYEVTNYLPIHQGGDALLKWGGKDATTAVSGPQHPSTVWRLLSRYKIGEIETEMNATAKEANEALSWDNLSGLL